MISEQQNWKKLFDGRTVSEILPYWDLDSDREALDLVARGNGRISLSGVQTKYSVVADSGRIRLVENGEQGQYILKPAPTARFLLERKYIPANEYLTMQIASRIYGIRTAANGLCRFGNGEEAYITRRFDVKPDGTKYLMEDLASIAGLNRENAGESYKYSHLSYEECASLIGHSVKAAQVEILKFFRLVVYNFLMSNDDAHLKNFTLIERKEGDYVLAPAYDLMNTSLHLVQPRIFALDKGLFHEGMEKGDTAPIGRAPFAEFGRRIGLSSTIVKKELDRFASEYPEIEKMVFDGHLPEKLAQSYWKAYIYRRSTLREK